MHSGLESELRKIQQLISDRYGKRSSILNNGILRVYDDANGTYQDRDYISNNRYAGDALMAFLRDSYDIAGNGQTKASEITSPRTTPSWWQDLQLGVPNEELFGIEALNASIPWLLPYEQAQVARYLGQYADETNLPESYRANLSNYRDTPEGSPATTDQWLSGLDKGFSLPSTQKDSGGASWLQGLVSSMQLGPGATRAQRATSATAYNDAMAKVPEGSSEFKAIANALYNPYLKRAEYGQTTSFGRYQRKPTVAGGLVSNQWYT